MVPGGSRPRHTEDRQCLRWARPGPGRFFCGLRAACLMPSVTLSQGLTSSLTLPTSISLVHSWSCWEMEFRGLPLQPLIGRQNLKRTES